MPESSPQSPGSSGALVAQRTPPFVPDHTLLRMIGRGSYGEVWLARNVMGTYRAVKVVYRSTFDHDGPYEREFAGIRKFEPISRSHESQVDILHIGRNDTEKYFYYVMELADDANGGEFDPVRYAPKTLDAVVEKEGRQRFAECLRISVALADRTRVV